ncbi:PQQ-dependent sugar dehydrogenase [Paenibacillus sedimenti]|uniref:PQQ-dependent sugar dehydrogenase n=1 Tax=Paenibacillus sedimenti TaxID=2770274 RepID=A0A926KVJ7_9BACL|nr:PQQ-dependent sugar dehydrogenase [Paenibacillus sedimenti]MBD0384840.1 PQQ-dependent sugar dehydrogenase [Paenibacillus sedimenti]
MKRLFIIIAAVILLLVLPACFDTEKTKSTTATTTNTDAELALEPVFMSRTFNKPVGLEHRAGYPDKVYITEQAGRIVSMNLKNPEAEPIVVLDIRDPVYDEGGEQGLLGVAFHPNKPNQAYVNYTTETHTVVARYDADPNKPELLDPSSEQVLLTFEQPYSNHNGGQLAFGPDGYLYIATGDGGNGGDPNNNSQSLRTMLGKILRIDVDGRMGNLAYAIPADNPFLTEEVPEIYAYGLRNPWRFSFDQETGLLWAADVGQSRLEEINIIAKGKNYGWRIQEGTECFKPMEGCDKSGLESPLYTYGRDVGVSITGGYVYRGELLSDLVGWYIYSDYGTGTLWALRQQKDGSVVNKTLLESNQNITSFGTDADGEIYLCTQEGQILRLL